MLTWFKFFHRRRRDLQELKADADAVLSSARQARESIGGAVNWSSLRCWQAEEWHDQDGTHGFRVWIEEASPHADELQSYVRTSLRERGWKNVEVVTEW